MSSCAKSDCRGGKGYPKFTHTPDSTSDRRTLLASGKKVMEPHLFRIAPGADSGGSYSHEGEEFIYVLQGKLEVWIDEIEHYALETGDSLYFESTQPHRWQSLSEKRDLALWVNTPATF